MFPFSYPDILDFFSVTNFENKHRTHPQLSSAREKFTVLVKADSHNSVSSVESLFHTITVMHINIYIEHSSMVPAIG